MKIHNYIYKITNNINGKIYIGKHSTDDLEDGYMGSGVLITKSIKKYGISNFTKEILCFCNTQEELNEAEILNIRKYNSVDPEIGYNLTNGGDGYEPGNIPWNKDLKGIHLSTSSEFKKGMVSWNKGITPSEKTRRKLSEYNKLNPNSGVFKVGHKPSYETKLKIAAKKQYINDKNEIVWMRPSTKSRWHPDWKEV